MKRLIIFAIIPWMFVAAVAFASPFLICDPQAGVTHYKVTGPSWISTTVPAQPDGSIKMDVAAAITGVNALTVAACIGVWCSDAVPFEFTRPAPPAITKAIRLIP